MSTQTTQDSVESTGKEYRKWLRMNIPGAVPPCPLNDLIQKACEDEPYNNSKGTWPTILTTWLPYLLADKQYRQAYAIMTTAFQHTNATEDQEQWPNVMLNLPPATRRAVFKRTLDLLLNASRIHKNSVPLPTKNMIGLYADPSWIEPPWFANWSEQKTIQLVLTISPHFKKVAGSLFGAWMATKSERSDRMERWLAKVREQNPSLVREALMLYPDSWKNQMYDPQTAKFYLASLNTSELEKVSMGLSQAPWLQPTMAKDLIVEWMSRDTDVNWISLWKIDETLTAFGQASVQLLDQWSDVAKDKRLEKDQRQLLIIALSLLIPESSHTGLQEVIKKEKINSNLVYLAKDFNLSSWNEILSFANPEHPQELPSLDGMQLI